MTIDSIVQSLSPDQKQQLADANCVAGHIYAGSHLDECLTLIPAVQTVSHQAMTAVHANQRKGSAYNQYFADLMRRLMPNFMDGSKVHPWASALLWLGDGDNLDRLAKYRDGLTMTQKAHLNTPKAAQNAVMRELAKERAMAQKVEREAEMTDLERDMAEQMRRDNVKPTVSDQQIIDGFMNRGIATLVALMMGADELKMLELAQKIYIDNDLNGTTINKKIRELKRAKLAAKEA